MNVKQGAEIIKVDLTDKRLVQVPGWIAVK